MLCFVLQRTPTNENNGGTEWRGIQQLLQVFNKSTTVLFLLPCLADSGSCLQSLSPSMYSPVSAIKSLLFPALPFIDTYRYKSNVLRRIPLKVPAISAKIIY